MEESQKLETLFQEVVKELESIQIPIKLAGNIEIAIAKRDCKRYGCCKQSQPDETTKIVKTYRRKRHIEYGVYKEHRIEISKWVLEMKEPIIKNTIAHELIHCLPYCSNHGENFKRYAMYINQELGYSVARVGNKKEDFAKSNREYTEESYKYIISCTSCQQVYKRNRLARNFLKKYRCGVCGGKLKIV